MDLEMKKAAKVFLIIGMVLSFYLIFPIVLGVIAIKKLDEGATKEDIQLWGILSMFFVSPIGGLFMLLLKPEDLIENDVCTSKNAIHNAKRMGPAEHLIELKSLYDEGIIDKATYEEKRGQIEKEL